MHNDAKPWRRALPCQALSCQRTPTLTRSRLLDVCMGVRRHMTGTLIRAGRRAYVSQPPFLMRDTVRRNITFGLIYDAQRYNTAVARAALQSDLTALSDGDDTNVGESGVMLSGGQRARVAFARALYAVAECERECTLYLEDIFAAVDQASPLHTA